MAKRWTEKEKEYYRRELWELYVVQNKNIFEIADILGLAFQTVFDRLKRLEIPISPQKKLGYLNKRLDIKIPGRSDYLAEFFGVMLGDGHVSATQVMVTLGTKELSYAQHVASLMWHLFDSLPKILIRKNGKTVYIGSVTLAPISKILRPRCRRICAGARREKKTIAGYGFF